MLKIKIISGNTDTIHYRDLSLIASAVLYPEDEMLLIKFSDDQTYLFTKKKEQPEIYGAILKRLNGRVILEKL